jgi:hypothetical protein
MPPSNEPGKPEPRNVVTKYISMRAEIIGGSKTPFAQPSESDVEKAATWISTMAPADCADIEPAIRLACEHVQRGEAGWNKPEMGKVGYLFGCIVRSWPDLREELHDCAPKLRANPRSEIPKQTPVLE